MDVLMKWCFYLKAVVMISALTLDSKESNVTLLSTWGDNKMDKDWALHLHLHLYVIFTIYQQFTTLYTAFTDLIYKYTHIHKPVFVLSEKEPSRATVWRCRCHRKCSLKQSTPCRHIYNTHDPKQTSGFYELVPFGMRIYLHSTMDFTSCTH